MTTIDRKKQIAVAFCDRVFAWKRPSTRTRHARRPPAGQRSAHGAASPAAREMLARYMAAFETSDLTQLEQVLRDDAAIELVPAGGWFAGRATCLRFLARVLGTPGAWEMVPTSANGQPAAIARHRGSVFGLGMLDVTPTGIRHIVAFGDGRLAARFAR